MRLRTSVAAAVLAAVFLSLGAACGDDDDDDDSPAATAANTVTPATALTPGPTPTVETAATPGEVSGDLGPVESPAPEGLEQPTLVNVRAAAQTGFDRIVFEFSGTQVPGYRVEYAEEAIACGSGEDLTAFIGDGVAPPGLMLVTMQPAVAHTEAGQPTTVRSLRPGLTAIVHAFRTCDFEGVVAYGIAISGEQPFHVSTLEGPPRLVIDVAY